MLKKIKKALNSFLEKLAKDNEKAFGNGTLDCCKINNHGGSSKKS